MKNVHVFLLSILVPLAVSVTLYKLGLAPWFVIFAPTAIAFMSSGVGYMDLNDPLAFLQAKWFGIGIPITFLAVASGLSAESIIALESLDLSNRSIIALKNSNLDMSGIFTRAVRDSERFRIMSIAVTCAAAWGWSIGLMSFFSRLKSAWENGILVGTRTQTACLVLLQDERIVRRPSNDLLHLQ